MSHAHLRHAGVDVKDGVEGGVRASELAEVECGVADLDRDRLEGSLEHVVAPLRGADARGEDVAVFAPCRVGSPAHQQRLGALLRLVRCSERRASGRKGTSPALVVRGSVRVVAELATPQEGFAAADIRPNDVERWRALRASLDRRGESRRAQLRFRRDPDATSGG